MPGLSLSSPDGRPWTAKEIVQGRPLGHPSHALFVHFPVAFYVGALAFDLLSHVGEFPQAPVAATWLFIGAFIATVFAVLTGLVDWWGMVPGSTKRRWVTRHMLVQLAALAVFVLAFLLRWPHRYAAEAAIPWILLEVVGVVVLVVGQWLGGVLVYEMGMRVRTGGTQRLRK